MPLRWSRLSRSCRDTLLRTFADASEGRFDLAHLQAIHRYLFGDVYEWAGQLRDIDITKGGHLFAHYPHIAGAATAIFRQLADQKHLDGLDHAAFSHRAAVLSQ
jgi:cell filamentation protein